MIKSSWSIEDEKEHTGASEEWWCVEAFLQTDNKNNWNIKCSLVKDKRNSSLKSNISILDMDIKNNKIFFKLNKKSKLSISSDKYLLVKSEDAYIKGKFPNYDICIKVPKKNIELKLKFTAKTTQQWVAQEITNGNLPLGLSFFKYGFIPNIDIKGYLKSDGNVTNVSGVGYFEHVWGNFHFHKPWTKLSYIPKSLALFLRLLLWWLNNFKIKTPESLEFCSENSPLGYDWSWAIFDNGWSLFYGNIMVWIKKGPCIGVLYLYSNDGLYLKFGNIRFKYLKTHYSKKGRCIYPTEFELKAEDSNGKIFLRFKMSTKAREAGGLYKKLQFSNGVLLSQSPGFVEGYYFDGKKKTELKGKCRIEPQRLLPKLGHNELRINFLLPPKGFGILLNYISYYFKKHIEANLQILPKLRISFKIKRIKPGDLL